MSQMPTELQQNKKAALLITRFPFESSWGGEESHTLAIAQYFREQGYEVIFMGSCKVLLKKCKEQGFITKKIWAGKMIVTPWQLFKSFFFFPFMKRNLKKSYRKLKKEYDIQALYCLSLNEKLFLTESALKDNVKVTWVEHQEIRNWLLKNPWKKKYKKLSRQVKLVPISKKNERVLIEELEVEKENIEFIVNGIEVSDNKKKNTKEKGAIVFANRLIKKKGLMDFLEAIKIMPELFSGKKIKIVGKGEERVKAENFAKEHLATVNVEFFNYLKNENWKKLLEKTDVFVSCAQDSNETFSLNTAEALSEGCKVVVTRCSGIADFLVDKKEAFLCQAKNPEDIAKKINEAVEAPEAIRGMAVQAAKRKFNKKNMLAEYYQLITRKNV